MVRNYVRETDGCVREMCGKASAMGGKAKGKVGQAKRWMYKLGRQGRLLARKMGGQTSRNDGQAKDEHASWGRQVPSEEDGWLSKG